MAFRKSLKYALGLSVTVFTSDIKPETKEYHFSPLVQREEITLPISEVMELYLDCDQRFYNSGRFRYTRTTEELEEIVAKRKNLEEKLTQYDKEQIALSHLTSHPIDTTYGFYDPLSGKGEIKDNFNDPRPRLGRRIEKHKASDIFLPVGSNIYSPGNVIVVAASGNWQGKWSRKIGLHNADGGLGKLTGNGVLLFNPSNKEYYLMAHLKDVYVNTGDVIAGGTLIGTVGKTGNAISTRLKDHLHLAIKEEGEGCGVPGVLVAQNPFPTLLANRNKNNNRYVYVEDQLQ